MKGRMLLLSFIALGIAMLIAHCTPTSPDTGKSGGKRSASARTQQDNSINRPGGHREKPLDFAVKPGAEGEKIEKPFGVWKRVGRDMRIFQDPAPGEGAAPPEARGQLVFKDDFERGDLGTNWRVQGGDYAIKDGTLYSAEAHNENVFLTRALPKNARIEFDAWNETNRIDLKCSVYDDGREHESGYVVLMGGWYNTWDLILRGREHDHESVARNRVPFEATGRWEAGKKYHWTIIRQGSTLTWYVDNKLYLVYDDPKPLWGPRNQYFSFSNWESRMHVDNLEIYDLGE